jgi:lysophospholipase L1-like esterase
MQAGDGLHPSAAMHALWLQAALPVAQRLLSDTEPD